MGESAGALGDGLDEKWRGPFPDLAHDLQGVAALEGGLAGDHRVDDAAEAEEVAAGVDRLAHHLLG